MTSSQADEAVVKIKHDYEGESLLLIEALKLVQETFKKLVSDQQKVIDSSESERRSFQARTQ
ncbi:MAG: hypothetical protein AAFY50_15270 [Cyanobacteria bacterium J06648_1]